eukprot:6985998-Alexandrium_andersonii.AAC.1
MGPEPLSDAPPDVQLRLLPERSARTPVHMDKAGEPGVREAVAERPTAVADGHGVREVAGG